MSARTEYVAADSFNANREEALEIADDIVARLTTFFEGEQISWGHAGTMGAVKAKLADVLDMLHAASRVDG